MRGIVVLSLFGVCTGLVGCGPRDPVIDPESSIERPVIKEDLTVGEGAEVGEAYHVFVEYSGQFPGGEVYFDRNDTKAEDGNPAAVPFGFKIGAGGAIPGMEEGVTGMKKGGVRKITVPWQKGYGTEGSPDGKIGAKQDLVFTIKLLDFIAPGADDEYDYTDTKVGTGAEAKVGDRVTVHYRCSYVNGMVFDDSRKRGDGGTPLTFKVGNGDVIQGVDHAIRGMKVGGLRQMWVPPLLAFGDAGMGVIQGGQILIVDVELLRVAPSGV